MFIKYEKKKKADGSIRTYVRVVEGYRDALGTTRMRSVKSCGYLEDQRNPNEFINNIKREIIELEKDSSLNFTFTINDSENKNDAKLNTTYNYGYKYLESIYDSLDIDSYFDKYQKQLDLKIEYKLKEIFKYFTLQRIMNPDSKRASLSEIEKFYTKKFNFSLDDTYRSFDLIAPVFNEYQTEIRKKLDKIVTPDYSRVFYDVTNYYFEIDLEDDEYGYRHRGVSKEHRVDPIIGLGLFMDSNGLPIQIKIFNGNTAESKTLISGMEELKKKYHETRIIVVADKGLNTNQNASKIRENGDGYIFSQIIRGPKGKRYSEALFEETGWIRVSVEYKYKMYTEKMDGYEQKVLLYWSKKEYDLARAKREEKILKALNSLTNNAFGIRHGYEKYLIDGLVDETTGEYYTKETLKSKRILDIKKIKEDERYDGYACLITSELQYGEAEIRQYYHELWEIEETFRITKTNLKYRPIYHYKKEHITVHFMICYTALLVIRLLQYKLKENNIRLSAERIIRVLNKLNLDQPSVGYVHLHQIGGAKGFGQNNQFSGEDDVFKDYKLINLSFNIEFNKAYEREEKFRNYLNSIIFA